MKPVSGQRLFGVEPTHIFFFTCMCMFLAYAFEKGAYLSLVVNACVGAFCLWWYKGPGPIRVPFGVVCWLLFVAYVLITPGKWFADARYAGNMLAVLVCGFAAGRFLQGRAWWLPFAMLSANALLFWVWVIGGNNEAFMRNNDQLTLATSHPNWLALMLFFAGMFLFAERTPIPRRLAVPVAFVLLTCLAALGFTNGRSVYLGGVCGVVAVALVVYRKHFFSIIAGLFVVFMLAYAVLPHAQQERMRGAVTNPLADGTLQSRLPIWEAALAGFMESPLFGNSFRSFKSYHPQFVEHHRHELERKYAFIEPQINHAHNIYLGVLHAWGVAGASLLLLAVGLATAKALRVRDVFVVAMVAFYVGYGLFEFGLHAKFGVLCLFFPIGFMYGRSVLPHAYDTVYNTHGFQLG